MENKEEKMIKDGNIRWGEEKCEAMKKLEKSCCTDLWTIGEGRNISLMQNWKMKNKWT